jgi:hypothetical protein
MFRNGTFGVFLILTALAGCQSAPTGDDLERKVDQQFDEVLPIAAFVQRYNDELSREIALNVKAEQAFAEKLAAANQPPLTVDEVLTALRVALAKRALAKVGGATRPRPLERHSARTIEKILDSGTSPEHFTIDVQVHATTPSLYYSTYLPTLRLPFNDIVIRQVYLSSVPAAEGQAYRLSEGWFMPDVNRRLTGASVSGD